MSLIERVRSFNDGWVRDGAPDVERGGYLAPLGWDAYQQLFSYNNNLYPFGVNQTLPGQKQEIASDYMGMVQGAYKSNGVVFACMLARSALFSEARFQFRGRSGGRPGQLFGTAELAILEQPGGPASSQTTGDLLAQAIQDVDLAGNWFGVRDGDRIRRLRPDWVYIIMASARDSEDPALQYDAEIIGFRYYPGGYGYADEYQDFPVEAVAHFTGLTKDPAARFRGMSWLTPVLREIMADGAATAHKLKFFENGATSNAIVKVPEGVRKEAFDALVELFRSKHEGVQNAYKTIFLTSGADMTVVGSNFQQMDFKVVQGAGETRIAAAARVHPVIVGLSEGLQGASLNVGNFALARRLFADGTMRPLWRNMAGSLARIVNVPGGAELWYDDRDISFLQEDLKDQADVQVKQSTAAKLAIDAGYDPDSVISWLASDDITQLSHTGLVSVQLQEPGAQPSQNGSSAAAPVTPPA